MKCLSMFRAIILCLVLLATLPLSAQQTTFQDVKIRFSPPNKRLLVDKNASLIFDDGAQRLVVKSGDRPLSVSYEDVVKVQIEADYRGVDPGKFIALGGLVGGAMAPEKRETFWLYLEYHKADGTTEPYLVRIGPQISQSILGKAKAIFGARLIFSEFPEKPEPVDKKQLHEAELKFDAKEDKKNHPLPEIRPDKALVVVVCPAINSRYAGANPLKIHANNRVVGINTMGTYTFFFLDPGDYHIVSQAGDANGLRSRLDAGKDYYLLQTSIIGWTSPKSILSRQSKELVMYEVNGAYFSNWKRK